MTTGPQDPAAAGRDRLRACHADREQVLETLKDAFVHGRLTKDELDTRAGRALARSHEPTPTWPRSPPTSRPPPRPGRARPPRRAANSWPGRSPGRASAWSSRPLPCGPPSSSIRVPAAPLPHHSLAPLMLFLAFMAVLAALGFVGYGVVTSVEQRRSRRRLQARPGPGGHAGDGERRGSTVMARFLPALGPPRLSQPTCGRTPRRGSAGAARSRPGGPGTPWREANPRRSMKRRPQHRDRASPVARTGAFVLARTPHGLARKQAARESAELALRKRGTRQLCHHPACLTADHRSDDPGLTPESTTGGHRSSRPRRIPAAVCPGSSACWQARPLTLDATPLWPSLTGRQRGQHVRRDRISDRPGPGAEIVG